MRTAHGTRTMTIPAATTMATNNFDRGAVVFCASLIRAIVAGGVATETFWFGSCVERFAEQRQLALVIELALDRNCCSIINYDMAIALGDGAYLLAEQRISPRERFWATF